MSLKSKIEADLKSALLSGDKETASTLRVIKSVILDSEIAHMKRDVGLSDNEIIKLLAKEVKKRNDAANMYSSANEQQRAEQEISEAKIIEAYLPKQLSDSELKAIVQATISEMNINKLQAKDMGPVIGRVNSKAGGQADGSRIATIVKSLLN
jgi:uncharacterized protein